jgi:hypothetical protein
VAAKTDGHGDGGGVERYDRKGGDEWDDGAKKHDEPQNSNRVKGFHDDDAVGAQGEFFERLGGDA